MAQLIQKARTLEFGIHNVLSHPSTNENEDRELRIYHALNCHITVLLLIGRLSLKDLRRKDLGGGETEAAAISNKPFLDYPYFTREELIETFDDVTEENVSDFLTQPPHREKQYAADVTSYLDHAVTEAGGGPCVVQVGKKYGSGTKLLHSFIMVKTETGDLFTFGKEGFTDPSMSTSSSHPDRSDRDSSANRFQFAPLSEVWKYNKRYVSADAQWRVIPLAEAS